MSKVTFYGLPAWVGAIHGSTVCDWWDRDPGQLGWDRSLIHTIDLAKSTAAGLAGQIAIGDIEVDDHISAGGRTTIRSEEHTSELQSRVDISYAVFCLKKK